MSELPATEIRSNTALAVLNLYAAFLSSEGLAMLLSDAAFHAYPSVSIAAYSIYGGTMVIYFIFSAACHLPTRRQSTYSVWDKIDTSLHALLWMSPLLPICLIALSGNRRWILAGLAMLYLILAVGEVLSAGFRRVLGRFPFWVLAVLLVTTTILLTHRLTGVAMFWFYAGVLSYLIASAADAAFIPFSHHDFGGHELAHILTVLGAAHHFILIYQYIP